MATSPDAAESQKIANNDLDEKPIAAIEVYVDFFFLFSYNYF